MSISSGASHVCSLRQDGSAVCRRGNTRFHYPDYGQALPPESQRFMSLSSGGIHTCGLRQDGTVCAGALNPNGGISNPYLFRLKIALQRSAPVTGTRAVFAETILQFAVATMNTDSPPLQNFSNSIC